jgi:hypothetical protein
VSAMSFIAREVVVRRRRVRGIGGELARDAGDARESARAETRRDVDRWRKSGGGLR